MRNKLLSLIAMALVAIGVNAQSWTKPEIETSEPVSGGVFMLMNVEAGQFLAGGSSWYSWATSTVLVDAATATPLSFTLTEDTELQGWTFARTTDGKFTFISGDYDGRGEMHVDMASQGHQYFELLKQDNGYYHIRAIAADQLYGADVLDGYEDKCWGWGGPDSDFPTAVFPFVTPADGYFCDWAFVSGEAYPLYDAKMKLWSTTKEADEYEIDYSIYADAYNGSDIEAITAATAELKTLIARAKVDRFLDGATEDNPKDGTPLLENPSFDTGLNGWTLGSGSATPATMTWNGQSANTSGLMAGEGDDTWGSNCEVFNAAFDISQRLEYMPAGVYKFTCQGFYRADSKQTKAQLYAILPDGTEQIDNLASIDDYATDEQLYACGMWYDDVERNGKWVPNGMNGAMFHFHHKTGENEEYDYTSSLTIILDEPVENLTIGVRTTTDGTWVIFDNFTLTYYGMPQIDPYKTQLDELIAKMEKQYPEADWEDVKAEQNVKEAYLTAIAEGKAATENYQDAIAAINKAAEDLAQSIALYATIRAKIENLEKTKDELTEQWPDIDEPLSDLIDGLADGYDNGTLTSEDITGIDESLRNIINDYISNNAQPGDDLTLLLVNPSFDTGNADGWELKGSISAVEHFGQGKNVEGLMTEEYLAEVGEEDPETWGYNCEAYHTPFDMSQTIKNVPAGVYEFSCQGFWRGKNENGNDTDDTPGQLYAVVNGKEQTDNLANINDCASEDALFINGTSWGNDVEANNGSGWVPFCMSGAMYHFHHKNDGVNYDYTSKLKIILTEPADITVGVRTTSSGTWVIFDNFRIKYLGEDLEEYYDIIQKLSDQANKALATEEVVLTTEAQEALNAAANEADDVTGNQRDKEACLAVIEQLRSAIALAEETTKALTQLNDLCQLLNDNLLDIEGTTDFVDVLDMAATRVVDGDNPYASIAEIEQAMTDLKAGFVGFVMSQPDVESASEETPADVTGIIFNADFELLNANYWTVDKLGNNNGYQGANYANEILDEEGNYVETVTLDHFVETWIPAANGVLKDGAISQQLMAALPEGYYILRCDAHAVNQGGYPEGGIQGVNLMVTDGTQTWAEPIVVPEGTTAAFPQHFAVAFQSDGKSLLTVGISVKETNANWLAADNFKLEYVGQTLTGVEGVAADIEPVAKTATIYNLAGQRVQKAVRGLYIINGKKVLVK